MTYYDAATVKDAARGRWVDLLVHFGVGSDFLQDVHGPCPGCNGKDRFRFDNQNDDGTFICSQGGGDLLSGDGFALLMHVKGWDFNRALSEVARQLDVQGSDSPANRPKPKPPPPKATFHRDKLEEFASRWRPFVNTAWLADRSPEVTYNRPSDEFLTALYHGEQVVLFTDAESQGQALWPKDPIPPRGPDGVWFLSQPVDGGFYSKEKKPDEYSRRSKESVTSFRYLVMESDEARARDWLAALVQLPLRIAAIYTSGSKSIHALVRVDARSIAHWRELSAAIKPIMVTLGADKQVIATAVRLSRLPGCWREGKTIKEKRGETSVKKYVKFDAPTLQKLLYLNPNPEAKPICTMPVVRDTVKVLQDRALPFDWDAGELIARHLKSAGKTFERIKGEKPFQDDEVDYFRDVDLNECVKALDAAEKVRAAGFNIARALKWFESAPAVQDLIKRLRGKVDGPAVT